MKKKEKINKEKVRKEKVKLLKPKLKPELSKKIKSKTVLIPSLITMGALFCGFLAIVSAYNGKFFYAAKCIIAAIILDGLDGRVARKLNATTPFGKEFDSLSDLISFGVAPAMLMYSWGLSKVADEIGLLSCFLYLVCCSARLARFNLDTDSGLKSFTGMPSPAAAAALVTLTYCFPSQVGNIYLAFGIMVYTIFVAVLMVSNFSFLSLKKMHLTEANKNKSMLGLAALIVLLWKYSQELLLILAIIYTFSGPVIYYYKKLKKA